MRKRYVIAAGVAAVLMAGGGYAFADPDSSDADTSAGTAAVPATVTLPTGDVVQVIGDALLPKSGEGDNPGFQSMRLGGDRYVIPLDVLGDFSSGKIDDRLFNVDALLRNGYTDAREIASPKSLGDSMFNAETESAGDGAKIKVDFTWRDGSVAQMAYVTWINLDTGDNGFIEAVDGTAELGLPSGNYSLIHNMIKQGPGDEPWEVVATTTDLTVTSDPVNLKIDGTKAQPVQAVLDHEDAELLQAELDVFSSSTDGTTTVVQGFGFGTQKEGLYVLPSENPSGHLVGYSLQTEWARGQDTYSLLNVGDEGIPADVSFEVHDGDLAARNAVYNSLDGEAVEVGRGNYGYHESYEPFLFPGAAAAMMDSTRTEYYTADPAVGWIQMGYLYSTTDESFDRVMHDSGSMEPGSKEDMPWLQAPLSVNVSQPQTPGFSSGLMRAPYSEDSPELVAMVPMFSGTAPGETISSWIPTAQMTVSKDGTELGRADGSMLRVDLPENDGGRYTVSAEASREVQWTSLGMRSTASWTFDSQPVTDYTPLDVSAVRFNASGVEGGWADVTAKQQVTLDFETQPGAPDRKCKSMAFEVSYDDGATWKKVKIDRDGDHATATLKHPSGAKFVSVKFTAKDDKGQTVETSTIRSYGIK